MRERRRRTASTSMRASGRVTQGCRGAAWKRSEEEKQRESEGSETCPAKCSVQENEMTQLCFPLEPGWAESSRADTAAAGTCGEIKLGICFKHLWVHTFHIRAMQLKRQHPIKSQQFPVLTAGKTAVQREAGLDQTLRTAPQLPRRRQRRTTLLGTDGSLRFQD